MSRTKTNNAMRVRISRYRELMDRSPTNAEERRANDIAHKYINPEERTFNQAVFDKACDLMETYGSFTEDDSELFDEFLVLVKCSAIEIAMYETDNGTIVDDRNMQATMLHTMETLYKGMVVYLDHRIKIAEKNVNMNGGGRGL